MKFNPYRLFLLCAGVLVLVLNLLECPHFSDDLLYRFVWQIDDQGKWLNNVTPQPVENIGDLFESQWAHYYVMNGRTVVHFLLQALLAFVPSLLFKCINALMFVLLLHFSAKLITVDNKQRLVAAVMVCFLLFVVINGFKTALLWDVGSLNYLWVLVATVCFFLFLRRIWHRQLCPSHCVLSLSGLLIGWSHEALSLPVSAAIVLYIVLHLKFIIHKAPFPYLLAYLVGALFCLLSPALWLRATDDSATVLTRLSFGILNCFGNVHVVWLLLILMAALWFSNRSLMKDELRHRFYGYVVLFMAMMIVLLCGTTIERVAFMADFVAILLFVSLVLRLLSSRPSTAKAVVMISCTIMVLLFAPVVWLRYENVECFNYLEQQLKTPGNEIVCVRQPLKSKNVIIDFLRDRYVKPAVAFDYYSIIDDVKKHYLSALYDKRHIDFIPEDVVTNIRTDSDAYVHRGTDLNGELFVHRISSGQAICKVAIDYLPDNSFKNYVLGWLSLSQDTSMIIDDYRLDMVRIGQYDYLFFPSLPGRQHIKRISYFYTNN